MWVNIDHGLALYSSISGSLAAGLKTLEEAWYFEAYGALPADAMFIIGVEFEHDATVVFTHVNLAEHDD